KSDKDITRIMPLVEKTKEEGEKLKHSTHDELRNETQIIQDITNSERKPIADQLASLHTESEANTGLDLNDKEAIFGKIDKLEADRNKELEKVLIKVLPKTFAIVRETARRFKENTTLEVTAKEYDIKFAATRDHVKIEGD